MTSTTEVTDWTTRAIALRDELVAAGKLTSLEWQSAILAVPRHVFVPAYYSRRNGAMVEINPSAREADREDWLDAVYSNTSLVTKIAGGDDGGLATFLSSSSTPGLMTRMLEALDIRHGHRVLEIGTGTGYNAGLLAHRLGASNVYSIDVEPDLVDTARIRLAELGYHPTLVAGDGSEGLPDHAPFDRIIATCAVPVIPWSWVDQLPIGGVILTDLRRGLNAGNLVRLTRTDRHRAQGWFDAGQASFMDLRHTPGGQEQIPYARLPDGVSVARSATTLDPRTPWNNPVVWFLAALRVGPRYRLGYTGGNPEHGPAAVFVSTPDGSRAEIDLATTDDGTHPVRESGPRRLWSIVGNAHHTWTAIGQPSWTRLGVTVTDTKQTLFADHPANILADLTPP